MRRAAIRNPLIIGVLLTPVCLLLAIGSGGAGHGDYFYAKLLYPYTLLLAHVSDLMAIPSILFAVLQFPLYGALCGLAAEREMAWAAGRFRDHNHAHCGRRALLFAAEF